MSGRNDGNSGSRETRRQPEYKDGDANDTDSPTRGANQADGKADDNKQADEDNLEDIEVEREASGE